MDKEGLAYRREGNCFPWIEDVKRAQALLNQQHHTDWKRLCRRLLKASHPLAREFCWPLRDGYYWTALESEYATDVMFQNRAALQRIYPALVQHATLQFWQRAGVAFSGSDGAEPRSQRPRGQRSPAHGRWGAREKLAADEFGEVLRQAQRAALGGDDQ
jgi:hypothetical protein